ncbi:HAD-like protein [Mycena rebaudengoi]|nr:HAD-like protein [Mycena rebaudengoi]
MDKTLALKEFKAIVFDCYGTLADWETGIFTSLQPVLARFPSSATWTRKEALLAFTAIEKDLQVKDPGMLYCDLLAKAHEVLADGLRSNDAPNLPGSESSLEHQAFGASIKDWPIFPDTCDALRVLERHYKLVILSNVDRASFAHTHAKLSQGADPAAYACPSRTRTRTGSRRRRPARARLLVVAQSLYHDIDPSSQLGLSGVWIDRQGASMGLESIGEEPKWRRRFETLGEMAAAVEQEE